MDRTRRLGLDFGTTNTVLSFAEAGRQPQPVAYRYLDTDFSAFRTALCFWDEGDEDRPDVRAEAGPWAIQHFLETAGDCRFIQSLKSFAASRLFESTGVYGRAYKFEDLYATFFRRLRAHAHHQMDQLPREVVVGRPVEYVGERPDAKLAMQRYETALERFGFTRIRQVYEPVAAAFFYASRLDDDATVLVADFGGGTTDFSIIHFEVRRDGLRARALGHSGVGVAGDRFDYRIVEQVVLPLLGKGSTYRSIGKRLEMPLACFSSFASWHELSMMKGSRGFRELKELSVWSDAPELLNRFIRLVETEQGHRLYKSVTEAKEALSGAESARLHFQHEDFTIDEVVARARFESWIAPELAAIEKALDAALARASLLPPDVDRIFLTGGSSFVPAVRAIFERRFGAGRIEAGDEFVSIANGLATIGTREDVEAWAL